MPAKAAQKIGTDRRKLAPSRTQRNIEVVELAATRLWS